MGWNSETAANAYLDTVKLRKSANAEPQSSEYISALAAGMNAQLIVEVCSSSAAASTIGLAAAARHTGGHLVCILAEAETLTEARKAVKEVGLEDNTEFVMGDAAELLARYKNVDFSVIDCRTKDYAGLFKYLDMNPSQAVVVANNLFERNATSAYGSTFKRKPGSKSITLPIGKGIEVTRIGNNNNCSKKPVKKMTRTADHHERKSCTCSNVKAHNCNKTKWITEIDQRTGEENVFRVFKHRSKAA